MLAAFLQFDDETVLVIGLTHDDLVLMATGDEPPVMDIGKLAADLESPMPSRLSILVGRDNETIQARIKGALSPETETTMLPDEQVAGYFGVESTPDEVASAADSQEAEQAAVEAAHQAARELAVKQARARLN